MEPDRLINVVAFLKIKLMRKEKNKTKQKLKMT